jgi:hypothetical protein
MRASVITLKSVVLSQSMQLRLTACSKSCLFRTLLVPSGRWVTWRIVTNFGRRDSNTDEGSVSLAVVDCGIVTKFAGTIGPVGSVYERR